MITPDINFIRYTEIYLGDCMAMFDSNCPKFFANKERQYYQSFLESGPQDYFLGIRAGILVSAFGASTVANRARISWIMVSPESSGLGIGEQMMQRAKAMSLEQGLQVIDIAASHLSAPFFAKFGAQILSETPDGWGPGMHRIDMELLIK